MDNFLLVQKYTVKNILYLKNIINLIRLKHYVKNILIFIPLIFSLNFTKADLFLNEILAFISFSLAASFVYVINDIVDKDKDRLHPVKKNRPIASGALSSLQAMCVAVVLIAVSLWISNMLNKRTLFIVMAYLISNILYSFWLKNVPIIDVSLIALGFLLRVLMGGAAISVPISKWLLLTIMTLSFYLGFAKRRNEMSKVNSTNETRKVLKEYNANFLDKAMNSMMTLSVAFYALWSIDVQVVKTFNSDKLIATVPFVLIGMFRYSLIIEGDSYGDPTDVLLSDRLLQLVILGYIVFVFLLIYM
jgi:decaprenyl-phosphate phosphoribosyltransferase